jgi:hypothetical protein
LLQGISDCNKKQFSDVYVLALEGTHDATHLGKSSFYKKLNKNVILQKPRMLIEGRDLKPYIVWRH